jgi:hypothetical protein
MPSGPAEMSAVQVGGPVGFLVSLPALTPLAPPERARLARHDVQPRGSGPPTFLEQRHLLI